MAAHLAYIKCLLNNYGDICTLSNCYTCVHVNTIFVMFVTISTPPHHHTLSHFKQTLPNKHEIDTLYKGLYCFSPGNYGGSMIATLLS